MFFLRLTTAQTATTTLNCKGGERMAYTKEHNFDRAVIFRINSYIKENKLSHRKIAEAAGMTYSQLYQLRHNNQIIKLREYVALCRAFNEPLERFLGEGE